MYLKVTIVTIFIHFTLMLHAQVVQYSMVCQWYAHRVHSLHALRVYTIDALALSLRMRMEYNAAPLAHAA